MDLKSIYSLDFFFSFFLKETAQEQNKEITNDFHFGEALAEILACSPPVSVVPGLILGCDEMGFLGHCQVV